MKVLVVIPTYDERDNIAAVVTRLLKYVPETHVLIVDDASPDGTGEIADGLAAAHAGQVSVLHRAGKLGLGSAYMDGFRFALDHGYDAVCEIDADGSHDPCALPSLIAKVAQHHADVAVGSRRVPGGRAEGWGPHRHLMSAGAALVARTALGLRTRDVTSGFRCYRAPVVAALLDARIASDGYAFQEESLFHCERLGWRVCEVPIVFVDRVRGTSKLSLAEVPAFFRAIVRLRREHGPVRWE